MLKLILSSAAAVIVCGTPALAELSSPQKSRYVDPQVLLDQVRVATGGAAWSSVRTLHSHAALVAGGRRGVVDSYEDIRAGRFVHEIDLPAGRSADGFDGISFWMQRAGIPAYIKGDADSLLGAVDESFQVARGWWFPERRAASTEYAGSQTEDSHTFDLLRMVPEGGRPLVVWVDRATHLIDRVVEQQAEGISTIRYSDYRWIDGVRLPFVIRRGDEYSAEDLETVESVQINTGIPDSRFSLPPMPAPAREPAASSPSSATVPFRLENNKIFVPVTVNGKGPFDAEFDSGGSLIIGPTLIRELGLVAGGAVKLTGGGEGSITTTDGVVDTIAIGTAVIDHPRFVGLDWKPESPRLTLVGLEVLQRYVVRIDFDAMTLTLTRPGAFEYHGSGAVVPFHFQDNQPEVYGSVDGIAGVFNIDTGGNGSLLLIAPFARRYGLVERYHAVIPYGGIALTTTHGVLCRVGEVTLNGRDGRPAVRVSQPLARISLQQGGYDADRYVSGNIEMGILKQFNVTFDYARQQIILERSHFYGQPDIFNRSGMSLKRDEPTGWKVTAVYAGGPAESAGIHQDDVILSIDGKSSATLDSAALHDVLIGPAGSTLHVTVRSGTTTHDVAVILRDVL